MVAPGSKLGLAGGFEEPIASARRCRWAPAADRRRGRLFGAVLKVWSLMAVQSTDCGFSGIAGT
jgi:hypothetical protein